MLVRVVVVIIIAVAALGAAVPWADARGQGSGTVTGDVTLSPTCPGPVRPGQDCTAPFRGTIVIRRASSGKIVARVSTDEQGHFTRRLSTGRYALIPQHCGMSAGNEAGTPPMVRIRAHRTTRTHVDCDTGIR